MTAAEVAALLPGIPRSSVYDYARREIEPLPWLQIGGTAGFVQEDIEAWLSR